MQLKSEMNGSSASNLLVFDQGKREEFTVFSGFRVLHKHVRSSWHVEINNDELTDSTFDKCRIFILPAPRAKFYVEELDALRRYIKSGGSLLVLMSEGGEPKADTNINFLLEEFGIACNADSVIRTVYFKYFDPKEALVSNGIINRSIATAAGIALSNDDSTDFSMTHVTHRMTRLDSMANAVVDDNNNANQSALTFVYPYGATLSVNRNSVAVLSTGTVCYPISRPVCAFHSAEGGGRIAVLGSVHMFSDDYFEKEQNVKIFDVILKFLSEAQLKMCLQESEVEQTMLGDFTKLFDTSLCNIGLNNWAESIKCYERLSLKHEPLTLVNPVFEVPQPPLEPAIFSPNFREISPPQLELFDLDDAFSSHEVRLAQLTNRCAENELDLYVREAGELLGVNRGLAPDEKTSKRILEHVIHQIVEFKKTGGQDVDVPPAFMVKDDEDHAIGDGHPFEAVNDEEGHYFSDIDEYDDLHEG
ncbi:ABC-type uncharacterized transport system domain-containing protein [Ditylenchus destructor]|uniref:ABC-type uncharacterized transport system domain-containing protein n=1 Tax=Ditylenchus destructor TaxID=166010 RepID=A0AAD4R7D0_9BILA|nr:ABC-type uncharacterized transport system domain-containing protein [Ditylenchus destructor]